MVDSTRNPVYAAEDKIILEVSGKGRISGLEGGERRGLAGLKEARRTTTQVRCFVILQSIRTRRRSGFGQQRPVWPEIK